MTGGTHLDLDVNATGYLLIMIDLSGAYSPTPHHLSSLFRPRLANAIFLSVDLKIRKVGRNMLDLIPMPKAWSRV